MQMSGLVTSMFIGFSFDVAMRMNTLDMHFTFTHMYTHDCTYFGLVPVLFPKLPTLLTLVLTSTLRTLASPCVVLLQSPGSASVGRFESYASLLGDRSVRFALITYT